MEKDREQEKQRIIDVVAMRDPLSSTAEIGEIFDRLVCFDCVLSRVV